MTYDKLFVFPFIVTPLFPVYHTHIHIHKYKHATHIHTHIHATTLTYVTNKYIPVVYASCQSISQS